MKVRGEIWIDIIVWTVGIVLIGLVVVAGMSDCGHRESCEDSGGEVVKHNCRWRGKVYTCDWFCGTRMEAPLP